MVRLIGVIVPRDSELRFYDLKRHIDIGFTRIICMNRVNIYKIRPNRVRRKLFYVIFVCSLELNKFSAIRIHPDTKHALDIFHIGIRIAGFVFDDSCPRIYTDYARYFACLQKNLSAFSGMRPGFNYK